MSEQAYALTLHHVHPMIRSYTPQITRIIAGPQAKGARTFRPEAMAAFPHTKHEKGGAATRQRKGPPFDGFANSRTE